MFALREVEYCVKSHNDVHTDDHEPQDEAFAFTNDDVKQRDSERTLAPDTGKDSQDLTS
jgi:hypothetical protein